MLVYRTRLSWIWLRMSDNLEKSDILVPAWSNLSDTGKKSDKFGHDKDRIVR